ncbi:MAG: uroporphyrinogen decarboxylase [Elusimicrobia bacterium]|nr:uroporphyrinogen decarboxylase [Elusimicrobiota bacterium]
MKRTQSPSATRLPVGETSDRFLKACRRQKVDRLPVWMMRQAGRYLPEYREIRSRHSFLDMCRTPELAARVTLQPIERLGVDAAILFSDILVPVAAMGVPLRFEEGRGPVLGRVVRDRSDVGKLSVPDPAKDLGFVLEAIRILRKELGGRVPLIGFAGLPFTLASYIVEGGKSGDFARLKGMMADDPAAFSALLDRLATVTSAYIRAQVEAGAQAIQLFDTWAGILPPEDYERSVLPHTLKVLEGFPRDRAPVIHYGGDCRRLLPVLKKLPVDVLSIDHRTPLDEAAAAVGPGFALQGNLDPESLLRPAAELEAAVADVVRRGRSAAAHIFNLGHGILPSTSPDAAKALIAAVHRLGRRDA